MRETAEARIVRSSRTPHGLPRWVAGVAVALAAGWLATGGAGQRTGEGPMELAALRQGSLIVWVVRAAGGSANQPAARQVAGVQETAGVRIQGVKVSGLRAPTSMDFREASAGSFGVSASEYGTSAGSYGVASTSETVRAPLSAPQADAPAGVGYREQTAGSFGQASSNVGTVASEHGQTASSLGRASSSYGQTAGSYGQVSSSYGQTAGSFGHSSVGPVEEAKVAPDALQVSLAQRLQGDYPEARPAFVVVSAGELKDRLAAAEGTAGYPDVLVGDLPAAWWDEMEDSYGLIPLRPAGFFADGATGYLPNVPQFAILARAPHKEAARAFAIVLSETGACAGCVEDALARDDQAAANVAMSAVKMLLQGEGLGPGGGSMADPAMAEFSARMGRAALATRKGPAEGVALRVEVARSVARGRVAAVALRVVASSDKVFGLVHPVVVLRRGEDGRWRVLHVSLDVPAFTQPRAVDELTHATGAGERRGGGAGVVGVSLAAPADGETRGPTPELWWDNGGGAGLQVVEWQVDGGGGWSATRMYLVPDRNARVQTRVRAGFATGVTAGEAKYRWRVWSVGDGEIKLSGWRVMKVVR